MSMKRTSSKPKLRRSDTSHPDDLDAIPDCTNFKYIGDPVDGIRYKMGEYKKQFSRVVSLDLKPTDEELEKQAKDTVDAGKKGKKGKIPSTPIPDPKSDSVELGFDLMSLTARRGHFVDHVKPNSRADKAGLHHGDLVMQVNGAEIRDLPHDEVVSLIRSTSMDSESVTFMVVPKENMEDMEDGGKTGTGSEPTIPEDVDEIKVIKE